MDNALMVGLSRQLTLRRAMDAVAHNIANMSTAGFKLERPALEVAPERPATHEDGPRRIAFVQEWANLRDLSPGALEATNRPYDVAIDGPGYFAIQDGDGERYTRDGRFTLDPEGRLVTAAGRPVLDEAGGEIILPQEDGNPTITRNGVITMNNAEVGRLSIVDFADPAALKREGDGLFSAGDQNPEPVLEPRVWQGFSEGSNVQGIAEITRMIEVQRSYRSVAKMIDTHEEMKRRTVERLGQAN